MHGTVHFGSVATGVARMSSDGNTDMRGQPARPYISRSNLCASPSGVSTAGLSENCRRHLCMFLFPVWDDAGAQA